MLLGERLKSKVNSTMAYWDKSPSLFCRISLLYYLHFLVMCIHSASRPKSPFSSAFSVSFLPPPSSLVWYHKSPNNWGRENFPEKKGRWEVREKCEWGWYRKILLECQKKKTQYTINQYQCKNTKTLWSNTFLLWFFINMSYPWSFL